MSCLICDKKIEIEHNKSPKIGLNYIYPCVDSNPNYPTLKTHGHYDVTSVSEVTNTFRIKNVDHDYLISLHHFVKEEPYCYKTNTKTYACAYCDLVDECHPKITVTVEDELTLDPDEVFIGMEKYQIIAWVNDLKALADKVRISLPDLAKEMDDKINNILQKLNMM